MIGIFSLPLRPSPKVGHEVREKNNGWKEINQLLEETYSIPSEKISGMFVSEEIILFEATDRGA